MFKENTVFIVGAGASVSYGFPLGDQLTNDISEMFTVHTRSREFNDSFDQVFYGLHNHHDLLENITENIAGEELYDAARVLNTGLHGMRSIDRFLHTHSENRNVVILGKLAIATKILLYENNSKFIKPHSTRQYFENRYMNTDYRFTRSNELVGTWINKFFNHLSEGVEKKDVESIYDNITIICFNYDRCIEYYLSQMLADTFNIDIELSRKITIKLKIYHPYGQLGDVLDEDSDDFLSFGNMENVKIDPNVLCSRISTFTESSVKGDLLPNIHESLNKARRLIILGFGFEQMNMKLLALPTANENRGLTVYSTGFKETKINNLQIIEQIKSTFKCQVYDQERAQIDCTCEELFDRIYREITI